MLIAGFFVLKESLMTYLKDLNLKVNDLTDAYLMKDTCEQENLHNHAYECVHFHLKLMVNLIHAGSIKLHKVIP